jgi:hypothetical protein
MPAASLESNEHFQTLSKAKQVGAPYLTTAFCREIWEIFLSFPRSPQDLFIGTEVAGPAVRLHLK